MSAVAPAEPSSGSAHHDPFENPLRAYSVEDVAREIARRFGLRLERGRWFLVDARFGSALTVCGPVGVSLDEICNYLRGMERDQREELIAIEAVRTSPEVREAQGRAAAARAQARDAEAKADAVARKVVDKALARANRGAA